MTLAQLEERLTALEQVEERLAALEQVVEQLQTRRNGASELHPSPKQEAKEAEEDDFIPGVEYDLVVNVPPEESIYFRAHIMSIETPPASLGLSDAEWALYGSEDENE
jgi:hypothetical protein